MKMDWARKPASVVNGYIAEMTDRIVLFYQTMPAPARYADFTEALCEKDILLPFKMFYIQSVIMLNHRAYRIFSPGKGTKLSWPTVARWDRYSAVSSSVPWPGRIFRN